MMIPLTLAAILPAAELATCQRVAAQYGLSRHETAVLVAIRKVENGAAGLEFGVAQNFPHHPARRFKDGRRSFEVQAKWAAGTIKKRYNGDMLTLARRYCPPNWRVWARLVSEIARAAEKEVM